MALGFAVGARGADHNRSGAYEVDFSDKVDRRRVTLDAVRHAIDTEDKAALMDSLILCKFLRGVFDDFYAEAAEMLRLVTGWDTTAGELRETAKRASSRRSANSIGSRAGRSTKTRCPTGSSTRRCQPIPRQRSAARTFRISSPSTIGSADGRPALMEHKGLNLLCVPVAALCWLSAAMLTSRRRAPRSPALPDSLPAY